MIPTSCPARPRPMFVVFFAAVALASAARAQAPATKPEASGMTLVWSDEFDVDGPLDPAKWAFEKGFVRNEELQWYQPENARCEKGCW